MKKREIHIYIKFKEKLRVDRDKNIQLVKDYYHNQPKTEETKQKKNELLKMIRDEYKELKDLFKKRIRENPYNIGIIKMSEVKFEGELVC